MNTPRSIMENGAINKPIAQQSLRRLAMNDVIDTITEERIILDLFGGANSPNAISSHFVNVYRLTRKYQAVRRVLFKHAKKVAQIKAKLDLIACQIIRLIEIDETFKGRKAIFLLVVDASTGYILFMQWIPQRTKEQSWGH